MLQLFIKTRIYVRSLILIILFYFQRKHFDKGSDPESVVGSSGSSPSHRTRGRCDDDRKGFQSVDLIRRSEPTLRRLTFDK